MHPTQSLKLLALVGALAACGARAETCNAVDQETVVAYNETKGARFKECTAFDTTTTPYELTQYSCASICIEVFADMVTYMPNCEGTPSGVNLNELASSLESTCAVKYPANTWKSSSSRNATLNSSGSTESATASASSSEEVTETPAPTEAPSTTEAPAATESSSSTTDASSSAPATTTESSSSASGSVTSASASASGNAAPSVAVASGIAATAVVVALAEL